MHVEPGDSPVERLHTRSPCRIQGASSEAIRCEATARCVNTASATLPCVLKARGARATGWGTAPSEGSGYVAGLKPLNAETTSAPHRSASIVPQVPLSCTGGERTAHEGYVERTAPTSPRRGAWGAIRAERFLFGTQ